MNNKKMRKGIFGFKRKDVIDYLNSYSFETQKALDEKEDKIEDLTKENESLKAKLAESEENNKFVGNAILKAEKKAQDILLEAEKEALERKKEIELEIKHSNMVLKKLNEEIRQLKHNLMSSVNKYQNELDIMIKSTEEDDE